MNGYVRKAALADIRPLVADLRAADLAEIKASSGYAPELALLTGIQGGEARVACLPDGTPTAIYGIVPLPQDQTVGCVWMVATNQFKQLHRQFLRECRSELEDLCEPFRLVYNFTDARNKVHHRWIRWAGFTIIKRHETHGHEGLPFFEFVRITEKTHV